MGNRLLSPGVALLSDVASGVAVAVPFFDFGAARLPGIDVATKISRATTSAPAADDHEPVLLDVLSGALSCSCRQFRPRPSVSPSADVPKAVSPTPAS